MPTNQSVLEYTIKSNTMLQIEQQFIQANKEVLMLNEYAKLNRSINTAQKNKFFKSLELGKIIDKGIELFKADANFKETMSASGISWTIEEFIENVYGYKKSYAYRIVKGSRHEERVVEAFQIFAEREKLPLSIVELNKFAKNVGKVDEDATAEDIAESAESEEQEQEQTSPTIFSFVSKLEGAKANITIKESGEANTKCTKEELLQAIEAMKVIIENL